MTPATACPVHYATVLADGSVRIEEKRYANSRDLDFGLRKLQCGKEKVEVVLNLNSTVRYDAAAKAIVMLQRSNRMKLGFENKPDVPN